MKKFICGILATAMMFALAANVCAEQVSFTFNAPCQGIADTQLYNYHGTGTAKKNGYSNIVYMRHSVTQIDAGETHMTLLPKRRWELIGILLIKGNIRVLRTQFSMDTSITQRDVAIPTMLLSMV